MSARRKKINEDKIKTKFETLRSMFITGLVTILPVAITLWIIFKIFSIGDNILGGMIKSGTGVHIPGFGLLLTLIIIVLVGYFINSFIGKQIKHKVEKTLLKIPLLNLIYKPIKEVVDNLSKKSSENFQKVALVHFPDERGDSIGFITKENIMMLGEMRSAIFVPTTPNPTSGFLLYIKKENYVVLDIPIDVALKSVISLGSISPDLVWEKEEVEVED